MKPRFLLIAALFFTTLASSPSQAAPNWRAALNNVQRKATTALTHALDRIEATPKQRAQVRQALVRSATRAWALRTEALQLQDQIAAAVLAAEPDDAALDELERDGLELLGRGAHLARVGLTEAAAALTAEQRAELLAMWRRWVSQTAGS